MSKIRDGLSDDNRRTGRQVQRYWLNAARRLDQRIERAQDEMGTSKRNFLDAIARCHQGRPRALVNYLRSDQRLAPLHRHYLAILLEQMILRSGKRGRPYSRELHAAATAALSIYTAWREVNRHTGVRDHGQGLAMKEEAARFVIEKLEPMDIELEAVRGLMDRSKRRRKG